MLSASDYNARIYRSLRLVFLEGGKRENTRAQTPIWTKAPRRLKRHSIVNCSRFILNTIVDMNVIFEEILHTQADWWIWQVVLGNKEGYSSWLTPLKRSHWCFSLSWERQKNWPRLKNTLPKVQLLSRYRFTWCSVLNRCTHEIRYFVDFHDDMMKLSPQH